MNSGDTKTEAMLNVLGNGGSGDQFRGCCNTKTQSYILDAIDRINNLDPGGGGSDFKKLTDADKNYTLEGEDYIAVWLLEPGKYTLADDATVAQVNNTIDAINTALSINIPHIGASSQELKWALDTTLVV